MYVFVETILNLRTLVRKNDSKESISQLVIVNGLRETPQPFHFFYIICTSESAISLMLDHPLNIRTRDL